MRRLLAAITGALLLALLAALPTSAHAAAPPGTNLQLMSWNICGAQRENFHCAEFGTFNDKMKVIERHIEEHYVQAMLLQEICENDVTTLTNRLGNPWSATFAHYENTKDGVKTDTTCGEGSNGRKDLLGTAIVARAGLLDPKVDDDFPQPWTGLRRPFHCATAKYFDNIRLCNVHLTPKGDNKDHPDWDYADEQLLRMKSIVGAYDHIAFGGDFNVVPPDWPGTNPRAWVWPAGLYWNGAGTPGYRECEQDDGTRSGSSTTKWDVKFDYVFTTEPRRWCTVGPREFSDHAPIIYSMSIA